DACVTFDKGTDSPLFAASLTGGGSDVILRFGRTGEEEHYVYTNNAWRLTPLPSAAKASPRNSASQAGSKSLSVEIRQNLNTPPSLWATGKGGGGSRRIWDPNPELHGFDLGEASEFHWREKAGYELTGGRVKPEHYVEGRRYT